jgi:hypothetical protein
MHASVGGEVQWNRVSSVLTPQLLAGPQDAGSQDLGDLVETLVGSHGRGVDRLAPQGV